MIWFVSRYTVFNQKTLEKNIIQSIWKYFEYFFQYFIYK